MSTELDLDAIKRSLTIYATASTADQYALIAEVERLRQELATAKRVGAAEWHEERAADCRALNGDMCREARQHENIAAELRTEVGK